jgi:hypothetical protein
MLAAEARPQARPHFERKPTGGTYRQAPPCEPSSRVRTLLRVALETMAHPIVSFDITDRRTLESFNSHAGNSGRDARDARDETTENAVTATVPSFGGLIAITALIPSTPFTQPNRQLVPSLLLAALEAAPSLA